MGLTKCEDCGQSISDKATACPGCGSPTVAGRRAAKKTVTIQKTGKAWKLLQLISSLVAIVGAILLVVAVSSAQQRQDDSPLGAIGFLMLLAGIFGFVVARIGAWWHHG